MQTFDSRKCKLANLEAEKRLSDSGVYTAIPEWDSIQDGGVWEGPLSGSAVRASDTLIMSGLWTKGSVNLENPTEGRSEWKH